MRGGRRELKRVLAGLGRRGAPSGASVLIYHRVGGGSPDERDMRAEDFEAQLDLLTAAADVVSLDDALDRLAAHDPSPSVVLTFDDGFEDVYRNAWPLLKARGMPFVVYLCSSFVGGTMHWDGSTAKAAGPALTWHQLQEMVGTGLCTVGNHTDTHCVPHRLTTDELDRCTTEIERRLEVTPRHFAWTWGVPVPALQAQLAERFESCATGIVGRNLPGCDPQTLRRIPVRGTDPLPFFEAKVAGSLLPEMAYERIVSTAKKVGLRA
ncbi:MAG TPA: polysaccharide deacetylase family protein [Actinomycetales bacterium]|nr:polysaccharide deacetylase family protein [Actinomycetales bacterium]